MNTGALVWDEERTSLGVPEMDIIHREFVARVTALIAADDTAFPTGFAALLEHTRAHFAAEDANMLAYGFPAIREHTGEHKRVLGEMEVFQRSLQNGRLNLARTYVRDGVPDWFRTHLATMDSALAAHLKKCDHHVHKSNR
jgi:hemerythrin-like metal-binding protein